MGELRERLVHLRRCLAAMSRGTAKGQNCRRRRRNGALSAKGNPVGVRLLWAAPTSTGERTEHPFSFANHAQPGLRIAFSLALHLGLPPKERGFPSPAGAGVDPTPEMDSPVASACRPRSVQSGRAEPPAHRQNLPGGGSTLPANHVDTDTSDHLVRCGRTYRSPAFSLRSGRYAKGGRSNSAGGCSRFADRCPGQCSRRGRCGRE